MKILYVTNGINGAGGLERVLSVKTGWLAREYGYEIHILTLNETEGSPFYEFDPSIKFHNIIASGNPLTYLRQYARGVKLVIQNVAPDVISVCDDGLKGFFLPRLTGRKQPFIYERHASVSLNVSTSLQGKVVAGLMRFLARDFKKFVVLTPSNIKEWKLPNAIVIPNPLSFFPDEISTLQNKKVISVGSHSYNKGYDLLLKSWKLVQARHPDWQLCIYGKADPDRTFIKFAKELQLCGSVHFFEPVPEIDLKYMESSVMALPSRSEGFGMVLIEAMICGVPCVSFDCPSGPRDIIRDGEDGFLVENGNVESFAAKIDSLIADPVLRSKMGRTARENASRFSPRAIVAQWDQLFKSLVR